MKSTVMLYCITVELNMYIFVYIFYQPTIDSRNPCTSLKHISSLHLFELVPFVCYIFDKYKARSALVIRLTGGGEGDCAGGREGVERRLGEGGSALIGARSRLEFSVVL